MQSCQGSAGKFEKPPLFPRECSFKPVCSFPESGGGTQRPVAQTSGTWGRAASLSQDISLRAGWGAPTSTQNTAAPLRFKPRRLWGGRGCKKGRGFPQPLLPFRKASAKLSIYTPALSTFRGKIALASRFELFAPQFCRNRGLWKPRPIKHGVSIPQVKGPWWRPLAGKWLAL